MRSSSSTWLTQNMPEIFSCHKEVEPYQEDLSLGWRIKDLVIPLGSTDHSFMKFRHSFSRKRDEAAFIKNMGFLVLHSLPLLNLFGYFHLHALIPFFLKKKMISCCCTKKVKPATERAAVINFYLNLSLCLCCELLRIFWNILIWVSLLHLNLIPIYLICSDIFICLFTKIWLTFGHLTFMSSDSFLAWHSYTFHKLSCVFFFNVCISCFS